MIATVNSSALFSEDILCLFKNRYLLREEVIQVDSRLKKKGSASNATKLNLFMS